MAWRLAAVARSLRLASCGAGPWRAPWRAPSLLRNARQRLSVNENGTPFSVTVPLTPSRVEPNVPLKISG